MISYFQQLDLFQSFRRFPLSSVMAIIATVLAITIISTDGDVSSEMAPTVSLMVVSYFFFLGGIVSRLIGESRESATSEFVSIGVFGAVAILVFILLPDDYDLLNTKLFRFPFFFFGIAGMLHLIIAYVPFISRGSDGDFWEYNRKVFIRIVESGFFSGVLYLAILLAMVALDKLFGVEFEGRVYGYVAVSVFGIFNSIYFLSKFPALDYDDQVERPLSAFLVFTQFLLIPITVIYMIILYAYGIKILLDGELPRGWIGHLSLWFSVIGVFTYLLNYLNPRFSNRTFVRQFIKYFFIVLIVPSILLMISLFRRISDYGVTEERYALAMIASWLVLVIFLYGILRWRSLKWLPISLSALVAFGLFAGPWGIFGATLNSQQGRLYDMMHPIGLLDEDGEAVDSVLINIHNQLRYLDERSDMTFINDWIKSPISLNNEYIKQDTSNYQLIADHFNIPDQYQYNYGSEYQNFSIQGRGDFSESIEGYLHMNVFDVPPHIEKDDDAARLQFGKFYVSYLGTEYAMDLDKHVMQWMSTQSSMDDWQTVPVTLGAYNGELYFSELSGERYIKSDSISIHHARGFILIK